MHNNWQSFLRQQSANIVDGVVTDYGDSSAEILNTIDDNVFADLSHLDVLELRGNDAADFLHGQLSCDVKALSENSFQPGSWCNIKGRVICSFLLYQSTDGFFLLLERELSESIIKRLQMFVMRSDVTIENRNDELVRIGLRGKTLHMLFKKYCEVETAHTPDIVLHFQERVTRSIVLCSVEQAKHIWQQLSQKGSVITGGQWARYDIEAGIAWVGKAGSEEFLPQSLNLDLLGGLSFDKGCYPGQEIIARMHFRGKLKQRLFLCSLATNKPVHIGDKLYVENVKAQAGMVVNATQVSDDCCLMLVTLDLEYAENTNIHAGSEDGPVLGFLPQPYSLDC